MVEILVTAFLVALLVSVVVMVSNRFSEKKTPLDKKYFKKAAILYVLGVMAVYLYDFIVWHV